MQRPAARPHRRPKACEGGVAPPTAFRRPADFRRWLKANHASAPELMIRLFRVHARDKGMTYPEALDEALCYGWIDGVRRGFDADSFVQRFTPRRPKSKWSAVNLRHYKRLKLEGRIQPAGAAAFGKRNRNAKPYSFESRPLAFDRQSAAALKANARAWRYFQSQPPWYRRVSTFLVMSAKREETRKRRLALLIACSAKGKTIPPLTR